MCANGRASGAICSAGRLYGLPDRLASTRTIALCGVRKECEMATSELREESGVKDRKAFTQAIDELQSAMIVIPNEVVYEPRFTYLWGLAEERFAKQPRKVDRKTALRELARCFLD